MSEMWETAIIDPATVVLLFIAGFFLRLIIAVIKKRDYEIQGRKSESRSPGTTNGQCIERPEESTSESDSAAQSA